MKKIEDLEDYIGVLLNSHDENKEIKGEIPNVQLLLNVYSLGLQRKDLTAEFLLEPFMLQNTPAPFHTLIGQLSILKGKTENWKPTEYLIENTNHLLKEFKYFILTPPKE